MKTLHSYLKIVSLSALVLASSLQAEVSYYRLPSALKDPTALVEGPDGNIYGTASGGGVANDGAIFKMTTNGQFTVLASFSGPEGVGPASLTLVDGNLYGVASSGGANGVGTLFKATTAGTLTGLYSFDNSPLGSHPICPLVLGSDGNLYGSTPDSGNPLGRGTIFNTTLSGTVQTVASPGGAVGMVRYTDGDIYGVKYNGTIFHLLSDGTVTNIGQAPWSPGGNGFFVGQDGNFYGCALAGGDNGTGCVYKMTPTGALTILASCAEDNGSFQPNATGIQPRSLIQGKDGNFYGTTTYGAQYGWGGVYQLTPQGQFTRLCDFVTTNGTAPLMQASDGNIYGASADASAGSLIAARSLTREGYIFSVRPHVLPTGKYNGLFAETNVLGETVVNVASAGMIKNMNVNKAGLFNGKLLLAGGTYPFSGALDTGGNATVTVPVAAGSVVVTMALDAVTGVIKGSVAESTGKWIAPLRANRGLTKALRARYTMLIPSADPSGVSAPPGAGYETINNANGIVSFVGAVADGTVANLAGIPIAENGDVPLYVSLYHGQGVLFGWINLSSKPSGVVSWVKNANATTTTYAAGFTNRNLIVSISPWVKPAIGTVALPVLNATLTVAGNDLGTLTYTVSGVNPNGNCLQTTASNTTNTIKAAIVPASGALTVQIKSGSKITVARGVVLQNTESAGGAYVKSGQAGSFTLTP